MLGRHTIKPWSSTMQSVALSSGEAEFYGVVRGAGQGLGHQSLISDLGLPLPLRMWTDSSAAIGICSRQGLGKLRHLDTHTLWVQQAVRSKRLELKKVLGEENPADLLTKHSLTKERLAKLVTLFDCHFKGGRAEAAPQTRTGESSKKTMAQAEAEVHSLETKNYGAGVLSGMVPELVSGTFPRKDTSTTDEHDPQMPHNMMSADELDQYYPSLEAVEDLDLPDLSRLEDDRLYSAGMKVVQEIRQEMSQVGRTRRQGENMAVEATEPVSVAGTCQGDVPEPDDVRKRTRSGGPGGDRSVSGLEEIRAAIWLWLIAGKCVRCTGATEIAIVIQHRIMRTLIVLRHVFLFVISLVPSHQTVLVVSVLVPAAAKPTEPASVRLAAMGLHTRLTQRIQRVIDARIRFPPAFSCLRRVVVADANRASRDAELCRSRLGPISTTFCSKIVSPSCPRRSVALCVFDFMSHCCFACKPLIKDHLHQRL